MNCIVSACPLSESEFRVMAEYLSCIGSEMINVTSFLPTTSLKTIFMMSDTQGGSTNTGNVDWTRALEKDLEISEDNVKTHAKPTQVHASGRERVQPPNGTPASERARSLLVLFLLSPLSPCTYYI